MLGIIFGEILEGISEWSSWDVSYGIPGRIPEEFYVGISEGSLGRFKIELRGSFLKETIKRFWNIA